MKVHVGMFEYALNNHGNQINILNISKISLRPLNLRSRAEFRIQLELRGEKDILESGAKLDTRF